MLRFVISDRFTDRLRRRNHAGELPPPVSAPGRQHKMTGAASSQRDVPCLGLCARETRLHLLNSRKDRERAMIDPPSLTSAVGAGSNLLNILKAVGAAIKESGKTEALSAVLEVQQRLWALTAENQELKEQLRNQKVAATGASLKTVLWIDLSPQKFGDYSGNL
jgi:hypothetical protein